MEVVAMAVHEDEATPDAAQAPPGLARVRLAGPLTAVTAPALRARVREVARAGHTRLLIDLEAVTVVDAAGIAALLEARRVLEAQAGGTLVLRANPVVCRALKDTGTIAAFALSTGHGM
jgi:anti-sigma B factor antagonist